MQRINLARGFWQYLAIVIKSLFGTVKVAKSESLGGV